MTQLEIYRRMSSDQRVKAACGLHDFAHHRLVVHFRQLHTNKTEREILVLAARRLLGDAASVL